MRCNWFLRFGLLFCFQDWTPVGWWISFSIFGGGGGLMGVTPLIELHTPVGYKKGTLTCYFLYICTHLSTLDRTFMKITAILNLETLTVDLYTTKSGAAGKLGCTTKTINRGIKSGKTIKRMYKILQPTLYKLNRGSF